PLSQKQLWSSCWSWGSGHVGSHLAAPFSWRCLEQLWRSPSGSSRRWITRSSRPPAPLACSRGTRSASTATALSRKETDLASAFATQTRHDADSSSVIAGSRFASYPSRDTTIFEAFEKWPTQVIEEWNATTECRLVRCHITHEYERHFRARD